MKEASELIKSLRHRVRGLEKEVKILEAQKKELQSINIKNPIRNITSRIELDDE
jgi:hypothetical protein